MPELDEAMAKVIASGYRVTVVEALEEKPATPSAIADESGQDVTHVSRALRELKDLGLVELLVPEDTKKGRVYGLTEKGETVTERMKEVNY